MLLPWALRFDRHVALQVFAPRQAVGPPRMAYRPAAHRGCSGLVASPSKAAAGGDAALLGLPNRWVDEELVTAYFLPTLPWKTAAPAGMSHLYREVPRLSEEGLEVTVTVRDESSGESSKVKATEVAEGSVWLVFTSRHVYLLEENLTSAAPAKGFGWPKQGRRFRDAPRPLVLRRWPLHCLQLLKIGFLFQSLLIGFAGAETDDVDDEAPSAYDLAAPNAYSRSADGAVVASFSGGSAVGSSVVGGGPRLPTAEGASVTIVSASSARKGPSGLPEGAEQLVVSGGFVLLTRDKSATSALLTEARELAQAARAGRRPPITDSVRLGEGGLAGRGDWLDRARV